jgi:hypothetical protein
MASLIGPEDLQLWMDGKYLLGKDWCRGLLHNNHTFENPLVLWKYTVDDPDGVAGSGPVCAGVPTIPRYIDTSLRNEKQKPNNMPFMVTHHGLLIERRATRNDLIAQDAVLNSDVTGSGQDNLKVVEARIWYQLFIDDDESPCDEGLVSEFPPGFGLEGDFTSEDMSYYRTGMNNMSVVRMLPGPLTLAKTIKSQLLPMHGPLTLVRDEAVAATLPFVGVRDQIYWFKSRP